MAGAVRGERRERQEDAAARATANKRTAEEEVRAAVGELTHVDVVLSDGTKIRVAPVSRDPYMVEVKTRRANIDAALAEERKRFRCERERSGGVEWFLV